MEELMDRAREWVNENYPHLEGDDYSAKLEETLWDLAEIDGTDPINYLTYYN